MKPAIGIGNNAGGGSGSSVGGVAVISANNECFPDIETPRTDYSSIRGKKVLVSPTEEQFELLKKRLDERTQDSRGETIYEIGVGEGKYQGGNYIKCKVQLQNN